MPRTGGPEGEQLFPIIPVGPPPADLLSPAYQQWRTNARHIRAHNRVSQRLSRLHRELDDYRDVFIVDGNGMGVNVLARPRAGGPAGFPLPFALLRGSASNKLRVQAGVLYGPSVVAGIGDGASEVFPTIGGTLPIYDSGAPEITVPVSASYGYAYIKLVFDPVVVEADGEFYVDGLELASADVQTLSALPTDATAASCDPVTGEPSQGIAYKTLGLIRIASGATAPDVIQISYGNWYLQTCADGDIVIYEPNYLAQTVNVTNA